MYAIIRCGGKQYKVSPGDSIRVEKLEQDVGAKFKIDEVLFVGGDKSYVGQPLVAKASVSVVVTNQCKDKKVLVFKKKRRKGFSKMKGHRQLYTELFVEELSGPDGSEKAKAQAKVVDRTKKKEAAPKKAAPKKKVAAKKKTAKKKTAKKKAAKKKTTKKA